MAAEEELSRLVVRFIGDASYFTKALEDSASRLSAWSGSAVADIMRVSEAITAIGSVGGVSCCDIDGHVLRCCDGLTVRPCHVSHPL